MSIFKSFLFKRQFRRQYSTVFHVILQALRLVLQQLPCKFGEVWLSTFKVNNEIILKFDLVF